MPILATGGASLSWSALICAGLALPCPADAEPLAEAGEVIVTAPSADGTVRTTPHSVTVMTAADIARSTATSVPDLLSRAANLNLQSFFGNAKNATIDIRGMGATASSNVLVLVDGVKLNENDLSGADLSTIPLSQIERVEIVRGGGAVRYGDGAVGGVINIITKQPTPGAPHLDLLGRIGSYQTSDLRANASAGVGPFAGAVNASRFDTEGYRQNSAVTAKDGSAELQWFPSLFGLANMYFRAARHEDTSGLPGPVSAEQFAAGSSQRRASNAPFDTSSTTDDRYTFGADADFGRGGQVGLQLGYRDRDNPYVIGYSPLIPLANQQSLISSQTKDLRLHYDRDLQAFGLPQTITFGVDLEHADYSRSENGQSVVDSSTIRSGNLSSQGYYANSILRAPGGLSFSAGLRWDHFETSVEDQRYTSQCQTGFQTVLVDVDPGPGVILVPIQVPVQTNCVNAYRVQDTQGGTWNNTAFELGLSWEATSSLTAFASVSRNFRNPNIDELLLAADNLRPQTGHTYEAGLRYGLRENLELSATAFYMRIDDEIYFGLDPQTGIGVNRNFDRPTRRIGGELEARWRPVTTVALRASVGYVSAQFEGTDAYVPLVPRTTANAEVQWSPRNWLQWLFSVRYVGSRFDGNDFDNTQYPSLSSYTVCDTAVRLEYRRFEVSAGINNLFNEIYSTVAYSATYYPMPERNYYLQLRWRL